jgi:hypothetical protein
VSATGKSLSEFAVERRGIDRGRIKSLPLNSLKLISGSITRAGGTHSRSNKLEKHRHHYQNNA